MKKLLGILFAVLIFAAPLAMNAEIEATAGSMKVGVHMDFTYRWSPEINSKNPDSDEHGWLGYDTFSAGDLMIQITGKVGDRITYKILEGLVYGDFEFESVPSEDGGHVNNIWPQPKYNDDGPLVAPLEAYVDFQIVDKLKTRVGKTVIPTLIANTGVHKADVIHTANPPLIANRIMGVNEGIYDMNVLPFPRIPLPLDVTGMGVIGNPIEGLELEFYVYDEWAVPNYPEPWVGAQDLGYDFNRTKGWDLAATYNRDVFSGNLTLRGFYFSEYIDFTNFSLPFSLPNGRNSGWGMGFAYDAPRWFLGAEYTQDLLHYVENPMGAEKKDNTWKGYYVQVGGKFGAIQPVARFDWIDYSSLRNDDWNMLPVEPQSVDNEIWYTLGVNWLVNDNTTVGLNYVMKRPETIKMFGETLNGLDVNELVVMFELDLL